MPVIGTLTHYTCPIHPSPRLSCFRAGLPEKDVKEFILRMTLPLTAQRCPNMENQDAHFLSYACMSHHSKTSQ